MKLLDFLNSVSGKDNLLEVFTDNIETRDYFLNVVPFLYEMNVIVNGKDIFGNLTTNLYKNVLLVNYSSKLPNKPTKLYKLQDEEVIETSEEYSKNIEKNKIDIMEPINFFKLLTM